RAHVALFVGLRFARLVNTLFDWCFDGFGLWLDLFWLDLFWFGRLGLWLLRCWLRSTLACFLRIEGSVDVCVFLASHRIVRADQAAFDARSVLRPRDEGQRTGIPFRVGDIGAVAFDTNVAH